MNLLHLLRDTEFASIDNRRLSPLRAWLCTHAISSLDKYQQLEAAGFDTPLVFQAETPLRKIIAYIDPENQFNVTDKLSQVRRRTFFPGTVVSNGLDRSTTTANRVLLPARHIVYSRSIRVQTSSV